MRGALLTVLVCLGCNQILGIEGPPPETDPCTGTCACRIDDDCGRNELCNDVITSRTCECAAGYARGGAGCMWEGAVTRPDPGQAANAAIADPGFESGHLAATYTHGTGSALSIQDAGARGGGRVLELKMSSCPSYAYAYIHVITPVPVGGAGPALALWSRMTGGSSSTLRVHAMDGSSLAVPRDPQWRRSVKCLDPKLAGRSQEVRLQLAATSCTGTFPAESAFIDDLEATVDPSCPAT